MYAGQAYNIDHQMTAQSYIYVLSPDRDTDPIFTVYRQNEVTAH